MFNICAMRTCAFLIAAFMLLLAGGHVAHAQANFDRPGGDYLRSEMSSADPAVCALSCERDRKCRAWSFNYPNANGEGAICWLKSSVPRRVASNCCISGVRGAGVVELRNSVVETATDRFGGDYRNLRLVDDGSAHQASESADIREGKRATLGIIGLEFIVAGSIGK